MSAFNRGDLFDMILIQVKGGGARRPSADDIVRLKAVKRRYRARDIVLAEHRLGSAPVFYRLRADTWEPADPTELFK